MAMASTSNTPPSLQEATHNSTLSWQNDLQDLFNNAKDRFPDVVWELLDEDDITEREPEEIWGHKAVVYARAPPTFQARYFSSKGPSATSPVPYSSSPTGTLPAQSTFSLSLAADYPNASGISRSPSPYAGRASPSPSASIGGLLRIPIAINPTLFQNELEYLYTGKGFGEAFEFLFDSSETVEGGDAEEARIDKLRKDLVFMWRSRLYSDVRIALTGHFSSTNHENATAIFSSHRFLLVSRSPYFNTQLLHWPVSHKPGEPLTLTLPSPPFTPASLHFTLGFLYTGTLVFSHRTFDLDTAFHIMRSASYLSLDTLYDEIQARIVQEMMHGLFHAFLEFSEYEAITGGKWGTGGCKCRQCARRAPRVLEFSLSDDVKNPHLERGARRALVGLFGEGWCTPEFARLPQKTRDGLLKGLAKRTTPLNIFPLLFAAHQAEKKIVNSIENWAEVVRDMVSSARKTMDDVLASQAEKCFEQPEWLAIMESDGSRFDDAERVEWTMEALRRGLSETNAGTLYQTLVSSVLLRPHITETDQTMLSSTSHIRVQVEQTRVDILRWLRRRWIGVRQEGGFDSLDGWALKEISHEIEVPVEDLFSPTPTSPSSTPKPSPTRTGVRSVVSKVEDDTGSMHSLRTSVLNRNVKHSSDVRSSASSVRSVARSTLSVESRSTVTSRSTLTTSRRHAAPPGPRPDSKLTPKPSLSNPSIPSSIVVSSSDDSPASDRKSTISTSDARSTTSTMTRRQPTSPTPRPRSVAASVKSTRSTVSNLRKNTAGPSTLRPPSGLSRPSTTLSTNSAATASEGSTTFETAKSEISPSVPTPRARKLSAASTVSTVSVKSTATSPAARTKTPTTRPRVTSHTSVKSTTKRSPSSPVDRSTLAPAAKRTTSTTSIRSTTSAASAVSKKTPTPSPRKPAVPSLPTSVSKISNGKISPATDRNKTIKGRKSVASMVSHEKKASTTSSGSTSTVKGSLKRKTSSGTIKGSSLGDSHPSDDQDGVPKGATLDIGIPCIISSKRARFRAYARYIGEVEGESGPWVGVEVPVSEEWADDRLEGRQWNDGTWGGIRYFDIGTNSEWDDERTAIRRKRIDWVNSMGGSQISLKREGDQLSVDRVKRLRSASPAVSDMSNSESRGLFVRPQQVLYVVDAVG
ncbi:hypothetical protein ABKN59_007599 [Abortiporus biennis]